MVVETVAVAFSVTLLAVVFLVAGANKLQALHTFEGVVYNFRLLPEALVRPVAYSLPFMELALAAALLITATRSYAGWSAAVLLGIFTLAVAVNLLRGRREIDCGCFSSELKQRLSPWLLLRNISLIGLALWIAGNTVVVPYSLISIEESLLGIAVAVMVVTIYATATMLSVTAQYAAERRSASIERASKYEATTIDTINS